jgi:uncharacterized protein with HEPN domain
MPRDVRKICFDILKAIGELQDFTKDKKFADYRNSRMLQMAVERGFEIIGEALRRMSVEFPVEFSSISDGRKIIDFRNILTHGYDVISDEIVWNAIENNLDILKIEIENISSKANE